MIRGSDYITVVDKQDLFHDDISNFQGFIPEKQANFEYLIQIHPEFMTYNEASRNPNMVQIIVCSLLVNPESKRISVYKSSASTIHVASNRRGCVQPSKTIAGSWSCIYAGHLKSMEVALNTRDTDDFRDPIFQTRFLDLQKEVIVLNGSLDMNSAKLLGYMHDASSASKSSRERLGLLYVLPISIPGIIKRDSVVNTMMPLSGLESVVYTSKINKSVSVDFWTECALDPIRKYLNDL